MSIWDLLLNPTGLTAHGFCLSWVPGLVALHAGSDAVIGLAYFSIPLAMAWFLRERRDFQHWGIAYLFAAFILACGATHLFSILTLWVPVYGIEGLVKALTAALSMATAVALWPLVPRLLALPSPNMMAALNKELSRRIVEREEAAAGLRESKIDMRMLNENLGRLVAERTSALEAEIAARRTANEKSRQLIEFAPSAIVIIDAEGKIELVNMQTERTFGYSREELLGRPIEILVPERLRATHVHHLAAFFAAPSARQMGIGQDLFGRRKDGSEFLVEIGLSPLMTPEGPKVVTSISDITKRKEIEKALGDRENQIRLMFDSIQEHAIFMLDPEGRVISWNSGAERVTGFLREDIIGRPFSLFYTAEDVANGKPEKELTAAARDGRVEEEGWRLRKDGVRFMANTIINAIKDSRGDLRGFVKITRDITERKKIENALMEANERFAIAADAAGLGFWDYDADAGLSRWDDQMYKLYGAVRMEGGQPDEFWAKHLHPGDRARAEAALRDAIARKGKFDIEFRIVLPSGEVRHLRAAATAKRNADTGHLWMFGVNIDVTQRRRIESELIAANERFALSAEAAALGFWEYEFETKAVRWDAQLFRLHGIPHVQGDQQYALRASQVHPDDRARLDEEFRDAALSLRRFESEYRIVWPDGTVRQMKAAASVKRDPTGPGTVFLGLSFDVTERKEAQLSLEQARDEAQAANRAKSAFLASMSHEIRTPMNGVIGFADLLLDSELTEQQCNHATRLRDAAKSLLSLMNDILDLSKIEAGKLEVESIPMSPEAVVNGALSIVRAQVDAKGLDLRIEMARDLPEWIESDPTRVRQILVNLLSNALKFTDRGRITVRCSREAVGREDVLRFEIEDTGIGIPADRQHLLFRDFSQVDGSTTRRYGGTGLGLSICKRLAVALGGEIGVRSVLGVGSTVWFTIALRACSAPNLSSVLDPGGAVAKPARVLLADDLEMNRDIVDTMLRRSGHSVLAVDNGCKALIAVQEGNFDVVLMDMEMPEMDGLAATRAIRLLDERIRHIPIVALTANAFSEDQQRCREAGMNDFLAKPIERDALLAMIGKWSRGVAAEPAPPASVVLDPAVLDTLDRALAV